MRTPTRHTLTAGYNGVMTVEAAGELLAVDIKPDGSGLVGVRWTAWFLADPDEIPTPRRIAILAEGMPLPDGDWRHVSTITTDAYTWFAMVEQGVQK